jgi:hypothetical protein
METLITHLDPTLNYRVAIESPAQDRIRQIVDSDPAVIAYKEAAQPNLSSEVAALLAGIQAVKSVVKYDGAAPNPWASPTTEGSNCIGFSWATSGIVEDMGMVSRIAHCNGHVLNAIVGKTGALHLASTDDLAHTWIFDVTNERSRFFDRDDLAAIARVSDSKSYVTQLDTKSLERRAVLEQVISGDRRVTAKPWMAAHHAGVTIMSPWFARQALQNREELIQAMVDRNIYATAGVLRRLQRFNYDSESRPEVNTVFDTFLRNVRYWARIADIHEDQIATTLDWYASLLADSPAKYVALGDAWRYVGRQKQSTAALARAEDCYRQAEAAPGRSVYGLDGKKRVTLQLQASLRQAETDELTGAFV